jgi:hypothetical protein
VKVAVIQRDVVWEDAAATLAPPNTVTPMGSINADPPG